MYAVGYYLERTKFLSIRNFKNILTQSSVRAIIALGVAGLILTQGTDLSAGRQVGLAAVISATMLQAVTNVNRVFGLNRELPIIYAIVVVCLVGLVIGIINGLIVAKLSVHPFIATLGSMTVVYGINSCTMILWEHLQFQDSLPSTVLLHKEQLSWEVSAFHI